MKVFLLFVFTVVCIFFAGSPIDAGASQTQEKVNAKPQEEQSNSGPVRRRGCDQRSQSVTDLSGEYSGQITIPSLKSSAKAKLQIDKQEFTLTSEDGDITVKGMLSAVTTCNYTAAAFHIADVNGGGNDAAQLEGQTFSASVKAGKIFQLTNTWGEKVVFKFECDCSKCQFPKRCDCCPD